MKGRVSNLIVPLPGATPNVTAPAPLTPVLGELLYVDLMRFVASVGIVFAHSLEFFFIGSTRNWVHDHGGGLSLFVDVFFVISGFIIAYVYSERLKSARDFGIFMQRRFGRLLPLHWLMLALFAFFLIAVQRRGISMHHPVATGFRCIITGALLIQTLVHCGGEVPNGVSWSISAEMVMYVCFPLFLLAGRGRPAVLVVGAGVALVFALITYGGTSEWITHGSVLRALPAFLWGMALYGLRARVALLAFSRVGTMLGLAALMIGGITGAPMWAMLILAYTVPVLAIASDLRGATGPVVRWFAPLGQLTYSMYMIHGLIVTVLMNAVGDKLLHLSGVPMLVLGVFTFAAIMLLSMISLHYFETPSRRWIDSLALFRRDKAAMPATREI